MFIPSHLISEIFPSFASPPGRGPWSFDRQVSRHASKRYQKYAVYCRLYYTRLPCGGPGPAHRSPGRSTTALRCALRHHGCAPLPPRRVATVRADLSIQSSACALPSAPRRLAQAHETLAGGSSHRLPLAQGASRPARHGEARRSCHSMPACCQPTIQCRTAWQARQPPHDASEQTKSKAFSNSRNSWHQVCSYTGRRTRRHLAGPIR